MKPLCRSGVAFKTNENEKRARLSFLQQVGLGYLELSRRAETLAGGEAQRIKLASFLTKGKKAQKTLFIFDEPTTGLHFHDIKQLLSVIFRLRDRNNTIVIIEHNLDVIKTADWIVDLGPEGGNKGGEIIAYGTPEEVSNSKESFTGDFLKHHL